MKRKIGELNNIPIVEGDPNLLKPNEILHKGGGQLSKRDNTGEIKDLGSGDSGSGEGIKHYYYNIVNNPSVDILEMIAQIALYGNINSILYKNYADQVVKISAYITQGNGVQIPSTFLTGGDSVGFETTDETCGILMQAEDWQYLEIPKGDLRARLLYMGLPEEETDMLMQYLQEITKEEYESLITQ